VRAHGTTPSTTATDTYQVFERQAQSFKKFLSLFDKLSTAAGSRTPRLGPRADTELVGMVRRLCRGSICCRERLQRLGCTTTGKDTGFHQSACDGATGVEFEFMIMLQRHDCVAWWKSGGLELNSARGGSISRSYTALCVRWTRNWLQDHCGLTKGRCAVTRLPRVQLRPVSEQRHRPSRLAATRSGLLHNPVGRTLT